LSATLAASLFLGLIGLAALAFGLYALLLGGKQHRGGRIGPFSERGVHIVAGVRMTLIGTASLAAAAYILWVGF
jgi:hypothetical protein